jgi:hypothetical protein
MSIEIDAVLDNDNTLDGTFCEIAGKRVPIFSVCRYMKKHRSDGIVVIVSSTHIAEIVEQLDDIEWFDGMPCYIGNSFLHKNQPPVNSIIESLSYGCGDFAIPKDIHYCWFGNKAMPPLERACVDSWKKCCPNYKLELWNESNYDISKNKYMQDAYNAKKWGFVPDYVRLDVIYNQGGFYLDTDVELLRSLDDFVNLKTVFAFESSNLIAPGLIFGSVPRNKLFKEMMAQYNDMEFVRSDGVLNLKSSPEYVTEFFKRKGICIDNTLQIRDDIVFLPSDFFGPVNQNSALYELTENTYGIHKFSCSWFDEKQLENWNKVKENQADLNARLLRDWRVSVNNNEQNIL